MGRAGGVSLEGVGAEFGLLSLAVFGSGTGLAPNISAQSGLGHEYLPLAPPSQLIAALQSAGGGHSTESLKQAQAAGDAGDLLTMAPHSDHAPWYIAGQFNTIFQAHPGFYAPYQCPNSLRNGGEYKTSLLGTLYLGLQAQRVLNRAETERK